MIVFLIPLMVKQHQYYIGHNVLLYKALNSNFYIVNYKKKELLCGQTFDLKMCYRYIGEN